MIKCLIDKLRAKARNKRANIFRKYMKVCSEDKILDLGSEDGSFIASIIPHRKNVVIADIDEKSLKKGKEKYGFETMVLSQDGSVDVEDKAFDIVHCSSVIEHVTVKKDVIREYKTWGHFKLDAFKRQKQLADEIRRIGNNYFVQTPNKYFPIEAHSWLPFINLLPRGLMMKILSFTNKFWIKKTEPDWNLLDEKELKALFPDAKIVREKFLFMTKSLMAIKSDRNKSKQ